MIKFAAIVSTVIILILVVSVSVLITTIINDFNNKSLKYKKFIITFNFIYLATAISFMIYVVNKLYDFITLLNAIK